MTEAKTGVEAVRAVLTAAQQKQKPLEQPAPDPDVGECRTVNGEAVMPGMWKPDPFGMPPDCPVYPLGKNGDLLYVIDTMGQVIEIKDHNFGQAKIQNLFGERQNYLYWAWPRFKKKKNEDDPLEIDTFRADEVRKCFYHAASKKGMFSALEKIRGRGCWRGENGELIYHCGDALFIAHKGKVRQENLGEFGGGYIYPRRVSVTAPWSSKITFANNPAHDLYIALRSWTWERAHVDAILFLGWIGAAWLGGALSWRPSVFVTGDKAVGKSTLQDFVKSLFEEAVVSTSDTTQAGIYHRVQQDSLPVAVDELEAEADNTRVLKVVALARLAASGGFMLRGGASGTGSEFQARSCFFFSSINQPPIPPADLSRIPILSLHKRDITKSHLEPPIFREGNIGAKIVRRLMDQWHTYPEMYKKYRAALARGGHDGRAQDTLGTLLTCAHLLLGDEGLADQGLPYGDELDAWAEMLPSSNLMENWEGCIRHLLTVNVDVWKSEKQRTIGDALDYCFARENGIGEDLWGNSDEYGEQIDRKKIVRRMLHNAGISLVRKSIQGEDRWCLAIPCQSPMVSKLFKGTPWGGVAAAGVWASALRQAPPDIVPRAEKNFMTCKVNGMATFCVVVDYMKLQAHFSSSSP